MRTRRAVRPVGRTAAACREEPAMTRDHRAGTDPAASPRHAAVRRVGRAINRTVLTLLSLTVVAVLALMLVGYRQHWETLVVLSGSMGRADPVGSLVVGRPKPAE